MAPGLALVIFSAAVLLLEVHAADPELLKDFSGNSATTDASFFTFTGFRGDDMPIPAGSSFSVKKATVGEFGALEGLGVSMAKLSYPPNTINVPHIHPRGTEMLYVLDGWLNVGLVDSTNKLYVQKLRKGDVFVFPRGLVHFEFNDGQYKAKALAAFSSSAPGASSLPATLFGSGIDDQVLSKAFKVAPATIEILKTASKSK